MNKMQMQDPQFATWALSTVSADSLTALATYIVYVHITCEIILCAELRLNILLVSIITED